uniref:Uncharacterized protein n=1 Tax=Arundo donax TaxID=35708 RepID=A0A0A9BLN8_ARUDO
MALEIGGLPLVTVQRQVSQPSLVHGL